MDVPEHLLQRAREEQQSAMRYVWGWQDATGEMNSGESWSFGLLWAEYYLQYRLERMSHMSTLREAWEQYKQSRQIRCEHYRGDWAIVTVVERGIERARMVPVPNVLV